MTKHDLALPKARLDALEPDIRFRNNNWPVAVRYKTPLSDRRDAGLVKTWDC